MLLECPRRPTGMKEFVLSLLACGWVMKEVPRGRRRAAECAAQAVQGVCLCARGI